MFRRSKQPISINELEVQRLNLEPGDKLIVKVPEGATREAVSQIAQVARVLAEDHPVVILMNGIELQVANAGEEPTASEPGGQYL